MIPSQTGRDKDSPAPGARRPRAETEDARIDVPTAGDNRHNTTQPRAMTNGEDVKQAVDPAAAPRSRRARAAVSVPRELIRIVYRDPEHVCERMTLYASQRLAAPAHEWVQSTREAHPHTDVREIADGLGVQSARIARIEGAVAGTPFYVALVPGYMNYLWQELRMTLRLATLYGRDPAALSTAAEALSLRGVYPSLQAAEAGLRAVQAASLPAKPQRRRSLRVWIDSVRRLLVFGGFLSPPSGPPAPERAVLVARRARADSCRGGMGDHLVFPRYLYDRDGLGLSHPRPTTVPSRRRLLRGRDDAAENGTSASAPLAPPHKARARPQCRPQSLDPDPHRLPRLRQPSQRPRRLQHHQRPGPPGRDIARRRGQHVRTPVDRTALVIGATQAAGVPSVATPRVARPIR